MDEIAREPDDGRAFLRRVQLELKLIRFEIDEATKTVSQSRTLLDRLIAEGKLPSNGDTTVK